MHLTKLDSAFTPYKTIFDYVSKLDDFANAYVIALDSLVHKDKGKYLESYKKTAIEIIDRGYIDIYKPNVIAVYTLLEAAVRDLIIGLFRKYPKYVNNVPEVQNVKISIIEYYSLSEDEKSEYLYSEYERQLIKGEKYGVSRFKKLLDPIGIKLIVDSNVEKSILELAQVRNCLIHRSGIVDRKLLDTCQWLKNDYNIGDEIIIKQRLFKEYIEKVIYFSAQLEDAVRNYFNTDEE